MEAEYLLAFERLPKVLMVIGRSYVQNNYSRFVAKGIGIKEVIILDWVEWIKSILRLSKPLFVNTN